MMSVRFRFLILIVALVVSACNMPTAVGMLDQTPQSSGFVEGKPVLVNAPPGSTETPTPFLPLPVSPTFIPTDWPTNVPTYTPTSPPEPTATDVPEEIEPRAYADYDGPTVWPDIDLPAPVGLFRQPKGQVNIVLLGSDQRPSDGGFRTDTILLLTLNPEEGTANLTSFPRDLYVYIPGWTVQRINTAFPHGGFETLSLTLEYNFGVKPDYYVLINFWSFTQVIDSLGGVDVNVAVGFSDHRDAYGNYGVGPGVVHMDGETALWYVRARYTSSDFDRGRRQQEVIQAIFNKLLSLDAVSRVPELFEIYRRNVQTDLALDVATSLLPMVKDLGDTANIQHYYIGPQQVTAIRNSQGAAVLLPIRESILAIMREALNVSR